MHVNKQAAIPAIRATAQPVRCVLILCLLFLPPGPLARPGAGTARAQASFSQGEELDVTLFLLAPEHDNGSGGIVVAWIPEPLQNVCVGRTMSQCAAMDFCIRTTTKSVAMCRNLAIPLSRLPRYPPDMRPRRVISLSFYKLLPGGPYQPLQDFYNSLPSSSLNRISMDARIRARISFTHTSNDDNFRIEQVLATAPF
jgi:hypothetical protein